MPAPVMYPWRGVGTRVTIANSVFALPEPGVVPPLADEYRPAVARGAGFLTRVLDGPEWRGEIDAKSLSIAHAGRCVLGQLFGSYGAGLLALGLSSDQARIYGLQLALRHRQTSLVIPAYRALDEAWRGELS